MNCKDSVFFSALICFIVLFFCLNYYATNQQFIFSQPGEQIMGTNFGKLIAEDILKYKKYVFTFLDGLKPAFYPLWGYPLLTLIGIKTGNSNLFLLIFQGILAVHGIYIFYKLFALKKKLFHIFLFIPFIAILSVKWPDGIVCYLMMLFCYFIFRAVELKKWIYCVCGGIMLGLMANFRSEYFLFPLFLFLLAPFLAKRLKLRVTFIITGIFIIILTQLICILPWAARSFAYDGKVRLIAANGGGTLYTSLGELPNNPWGLEGDDPDAYRYAQTHDKKGNIVEKKIGADGQYKVNFYPFGDEGNDILKKEAFRLILQHPFSFIKKVMYNFSMIFRNGLYTNEFEKFNITTEKVKKISLYFDALSKKDKFLYVIKAFVIKENRNIAFAYIVNLVFRLIFSLLVIFFLIGLVRRNEETGKFFYIFLPVVAYKILLVSFIQYSPRHMNFIYMFLLGYFLIYIGNGFDMKSLFSKKQFKDGQYGR